MWVFSGDTTLSCHVGRGSGKCYLFFLTATNCGCLLPGDIVKLLLECLCLSEVSGALLATRQKQVYCIINTPGRTHNRIRSRM